MIVKIIRINFENLFKKKLKNVKIELIIVEIKIVRKKNKNENR